MNADWAILCAATNLAQLSLLFNATNTENNFPNSFRIHDKFFIITSYLTFLFCFSMVLWKLFVVFQEMAEEEEDPLKVEVKEEYDSDAAEQAPATDEDEVIMRRPIS